MQGFTRALIAASAIGAAYLLSATAGAHGFVGDRFFPPTISTDDPFATDELLMPSISVFDLPGTPRTRQIDTGFEFDKEIFPGFALGIADDYLSLKPHGGGPNTRGWDNLSLSGKYELWHDPAHEAIISIGMEADIGGTGGKDTSDSFTTYTPTFYFGKGFGDLPDSLDALKPFALTGTLGQTFPTSAEANTLQWGLAVEYSLPYLQQHIMDIGLPAPFKNMIPLVEFSMETGENRDQRGLTTGTIDPGVLWETRYCQLGVEAIIPVNAHSGEHIGAIVQLQIFIDDLFPKTFGFPVFGD